jgi:hypothetical protein
MAGPSEVCLMSEYALARVVKPRQVTLPPSALPAPQDWHQVQAGTELALPVLRRWLMLFETGRVSRSWSRQTRRNEHKD